MSKNAASRNFLASVVLRILRLPHGKDSAPAPYPACQGDRALWFWRPRAGDLPEECSLSGCRPKNCGDVEPKQFQEAIRATVKTRLSAYAESAP